MHNKYLVEPHSSSLINRFLQSRCIYQLERTLIFIMIVWIRIGNTTKVGGILIYSNQNRLINNNKTTNKTKQCNAKAKHTIWSSNSCKTAKWTATTQLDGSDIVFFVWVCAILKKILRNALWHINSNNTKMSEQSCTSLAGRAARGLSETGCILIDN